MVAEKLKFVGKYEGNCGVFKEVQTILQNKKKSHRGRGGEGRGGRGLRGRRRRKRWIRVKGEEEKEEVDEG